MYIMELIPIIGIIKYQYYGDNIMIDIITSLFSYKSLNTFIIVVLRGLSYHTPRPCRNSCCFSKNRVIKKINKNEDFSDSDSDDTPFLGMIKSNDPPCEIKCGTTNQGSMMETVSKVKLR